MKVVILAGGRGTRLSEHTEAIPKPMLDVGGKPLLQHVMDIYLAQGYTEFIIPVGYKKEMIYGYFWGLSPITFGQSTILSTLFGFPNFSVTVVDTGKETQTGGRLGRLTNLLGDEKFHFTYGDGVGNVNLFSVLEESMATTNDVTLTAVHAEGRFGRLKFRRNGQVYQFGEKVENETDWINGGFSILTPNILRAVPLLGGDQCNLEKDVYPLVAKYNYMNAVPHNGYWKCVDTLRDLEELRKTYKEEGAKWLK